MVDHKDKFIYIHIPKTGGSSIESALKCEQYSFTRVSSEGNLQVAPWVSNKWYNKHDPLFKKAINDNAFKFAFVRNPFDLMVSCFHWWLLPKGKNWPQGRFKKEFGDITFPQFIKKTSALYLNEYSHKKQGQSFWLRDATGAIKVDFIGRFENIQQDFNTICNEIGIPQIDLPHINKTKHKHYTEYYDDDSREIVADSFAVDIEHFDYKFGE
jgi:chondroitin 4-sulfotransferase 11